MADRPLVHRPVVRRNRRASSTVHATLYYQCQPSRLRGCPLPTGHPSGIYVAEAALLAGVTGFLATAVYGPQRASYWERVLTAADNPDPAAPARARTAELEREVAELRRDLADREAALAKIGNETPPPQPDPAAVRELLATLPLYEEDLRALPAKRLRELMESLHLTISYNHKGHTAQIEITLATAGEGDHQVVPLVCSGGTEQTTP